MSLSARVSRRTLDESGVHYLRGAKVASAAGYISVAGTILGIPHDGSRSKSLTSPNARSSAQSEHSYQFRELPHSFASMDRKPLAPYHPTAQRSRLAVDDAPIPYKNASTILFNDGIHTCHKRRFVTTHANDYRGEPSDPRSNQGVVSDSAAFRRTQRQK